jgi:hypothetical protein
MSLKSDDYDPETILAGLRKDLYYAVGGPVMRMAGPELEEFLDYSVRRALMSAFSRAESLYIDDMVKQADQSSRTLLEGILAGATVGRQKRKDTTS